MITHHLKRFAPTVTIALILVGFTLVMTGNEPIRIAGLVLLVLSPFVPFLSLGVKPDPVGWNRARDAALSNRPDGPAAMEPTAGAAPDAKSEPRAASDPALRTRLDHEV
ncbi:MAG: hypothetical protein M3464_09470 [Chloroflexota bacterium]|nr:hypothetical protein [Chloroflexota bacterium]